YLPPRHGVSSPPAAVSLNFFFFQAEDGIRDGHVTGVQTCALPISTLSAVQATIALTADSVARFTKVPPRIAVAGLNPHAGEHGRSEERRVGKECRCRGAPCH